MGRKLGKAHPIPGKPPTPVSDPAEMAIPPGHPQPGRTNFAKAGSSEIEAPHFGELFIVKKEIYSQLV